MGPYAELIVVAVFLLVWLSLWAGYGLARLQGRDWLPREPSLPGPWDAVDIWLVLAVFLGFQAGAWQVLAPLKAAHEVAVGGWFDLKPRPPSPTFISLCLNALGSVLVMVFIVAVTLRHRCGRLAHLGLTRRHLGRNLGYGLFVYVAVIPLVTGTYKLVQRLAEALGRPGEPHPIEQVLESATAPPLVVTALAVALLVAPLTEELLFRGFLQAWLRDRIGPSAAIAASAVLFGMVHPEVTIPPLILLGLVLGYLYHRTSSLVAPVSLHMVFNLVSAVAMLSGLEL